MKEKVLVIGVGEIGKPLLEIIAEQYEAYGLDIKPTGDIPPCNIVHLCFPFTGNGDKFVDESARYIAKYQPSLTIVNSTVAPGTTRRIAERAKTAVVNSPVRGKHARMKEQLRQYVKFVGALNPEDGRRAGDHFTRLGMRTKVLSTPEASELAKLTETTYFGVLIAWAQEVERYCKRYGANYDEVVSFYEEIGFFPPVKYTPGFIGGHCVMPNIKILKSLFKSGLLDAVEKSNDLKQRGVGLEGWE
jgi:UDP-N-acetyl-D-mannosaminuronate dehydrogenase